jgi:hypothetical protein
MKLAIHLQEKGELLVSVGQEVDFSTPMLRTSSSQLISLPIAEILQFHPEKIFLNLKKLVGDEIKEGDLLAEHKTMFSNKQFFSEYFGIIKEINHQTGAVIVEIQTDKPRIVNCFFKGEVSGLVDGALELKVKHYKEFDINPVKEYFGAEVFYLIGNNGSLTEEDIENKCIVAEEIKPYEQIKLEAFDAKGVITVPGSNIQTDLMKIELRQPADFEAVKQLQYPCCIVGPSRNTIVIYE